MKTSDVLVQCYLDYLKSPMNPTGYSRVIGDSMLQAARHGQLQWDDLWRTIEFCHDLGFNPWDERLLWFVPFHSRWQHVRALVVFASRVARDFERSNQDC